ncbi:MAG: ATP-binding protein, partial [Syntrophobacter sp.]
RVPSPWRDYKYHMVAAILFFLAQSALIISLLVQKKSRKTAEQRLLLAELEARQRELQLLHADKMISLGTMAAGIAHEINNPNNFISINAPLLKKTWEGVVEVLDETAEGNGEFRIGRVPYSRAREQIPALLNGIMEGSERIRTIVRDMKEFINQNSSGMEEQVDMNSVVKSSMNLLSNKLNKSTHNLYVEYGQNIPRLKGNSQRLEQVVLNLILNAAESLPDSEKAITVKTSYDSDRQLIELAVTDEGCGIAPETLRRIFDPFFTTKRETGGTGLGLAISMSIVKAHGGRILISSREREGTTATVELPPADGNNGQ